jgi:hypothetical protein
LADTRIYKHPKRPEWGMAVASEEIEDRVRFIFEDAQIRAFKADLLHVLEVVDMPAVEAAELRSKLLRKRPSTARKSPSKAKAKPKAKTPAAAAASESAEK